MEVGPAASNRTIEGGMGHVIVTVIVRDGWCVYDTLVSCI